MNEECRNYFDDPDALRAHAADCDECAALLADLDAIEGSLDELSGEARTDLASGLASRLPLAPWEGSRHRSWGVVIAGAIAIICLAAAAFSLGGVSPAEGITDALRGTMAGQLGWMKLFRAAPQVLRQAPMQFHVFLAVAFLSVNLLFFLLLRRDPKGTNAPR